MSDNNHKLTDEDGEKLMDECLANLGLPLNPSEASFQEFVKVMSIRMILGNFMRYEAAFGLKDTMDAAHEISEMITRIYLMSTEKK